MWQTERPEIPNNGQKKQGVTINTRCNLLSDNFRPEMSEVGFTTPVLSWSAFTTPRDLECPTNRAQPIYVGETYARKVHTDGTLVVQQLEETRRQRSMYFALKKMESSNTTLHSFVYHMCQSWHGPVTMTPSVETRNSYTTRTLSVYHRFSYPTTT